jgi:ABC-type sugar transport system substrate-binding protein
MRLWTPATISARLPHSHRPARLGVSRARATAAVAITVALFGLGVLSASGCKKSGTEASGSAAPAAGTYRFAFVTNNSTDFWNIGEKGLRKAERDFG